jgi:pimeloyl-ACP methyl ester carboxylesterase
MAGHVKTHYYESGDNGPPVVLLHGGGAGSSGEAGFGSIMPILGRQYRVIALDSVGGYGDTDAYAPVPYGIQSRVDHLEDFADALCLDKFALGGNSQGAWAAARYAILHPDRVSKLLLVATATITGAMGIPGEQTEGMRVLSAYDGSREAMRRLLQALIMDQSKITDALIDARQANATRPGAAEARKAFGEGTRRFTSDPNLRLNYVMNDTLPKLDIPTIMIWGENDAFAPPELGRKLEPMLPKVKFHWIPNANHQAQNDQPEIVSEIMLDFLNA